MELRKIIKPKPTAPYKDALNRLVVGGQKHLKDVNSKEKVLFVKGTDEQVIIHPTNWEETKTPLLRLFQTPGYYRAGFFGGTPHAVGFFVTAAEFWYFDPAIGELKLDHAQVGKWLDHAQVIKYFCSDNRAFIDVQRYSAIG